MARTDITPLKKHIQESPKLRELRGRKKKARKKAALFCALGLLLLSGGLVYAARLTRFRIMEVAVTGNQVISTDEISLRVDALLAGNYAYLIPRRNAFLYPKKKILSDLSAAFPRLRAIEVYRTSLHRLIISVSEAKGIALWCGADADLSKTETPCYFTDTAGRIVSAAPYYSGNVYTRFFGGDLSPETDPLGHSFIPEENFTKLSGFALRIKDLGFPVKAVRIGSGTETIFILDLGSGKEAELRFNTDDDYGVLGDNLALSLGKEELKDALAKNRTGLQYFDLRFANKVYYKFSGE